MKKAKKNISPHIGEENSFNYFNQDYLKEVLEQIKKDVRNDNDSLILVDGAEGSGKTILASCSAKYVDSSFNVDRITFDVEEFFNSAELLKDEHYKAIQYDEAVTGLFSTDFMKEEYKNLIKLLSVARKRNLIIFMCVPKITLLSSHIVNHRASGLIHVYKIKGQYRGHAKYYSKEKMEYLYYHLKKTGNRAYEFVKPDLRINFNKASVEHFKSFIDVDEYDRKKDETINKIGGKGSGNMWKDRTIKLIDVLNKEGKTQKQIADILGLKAPQISMLLSGAV